MALARGDSWGEQASVRRPARLAVSVLVVEELGGGFGVHEVGPGLFGGEEVAFGEGVFGEPAVGGAAWYAGEDHGGEVGGDGAGDPDGDVGFVAVVGADEDSEPEAGEVGGVFVAVAQGAADEVPDDGVEAQRQPGPGFQEVAVVVVRPGQ